MICTRYVPPPFFPPLRIANTGLRMLHFLFLVVDFCITLYPTTVESVRSNGWISVKVDLNLGCLGSPAWNFLLSALNHRHIFQVLFLVGSGTQLKILKLGYPPSVYLKSKITLYP